MGDRYEGKLRCPYCGESTEFYYAPSGGFESGECEKCGRDFRIMLKFEGRKK